MSTQVFWYLEKRIIGVRLFDTVTIDDIVEMSNQALVLLDESDAPLIHILVDETDLVGYPKQFRDIYHAAEFLNHPQIGWAIFYGTDNKLIQLIAHMVSELVHMRHRRFSTLEEAVRFLQGMDSTLPDLTKEALS